MGTLLTAVISTNATSATIDVGGILLDEIVSDAQSTDPFGIYDADSLLAAISDNSVSSFAYVPSASTFDSMTASMSFTSKVNNIVGYDLAFFFVGGDTANTLDLTINGTTISYGSSETLYTPEGNVYTSATIGTTTYALSALFVDLDDFNLTNSLPTFDVTLSKGTFLSMVGAMDGTTTIIPLPAPLMLLLSGLGILSWLGKRK